MKARSRLPVRLGATNAGVCTPQQIHDDAKWPLVQHAAVPLTVRIPLMGVRLRDVKELVVGATIESLWPATEEVPLYAGGVALSWCEFEGADEVMAVRVTRLG